jgi:deazaflavin-dependent oxidoreductase (nitroreductase family)
MEEALMNQKVSVDQTQRRDTPTEPSDVSGLVDKIVRPLTRVLNPFVARVAGGRWFPMWSLLNHRGHKSGRLYATPISALPKGEFFWLSLAFGEGAGWARNILAAGECELRYRAADYHLVDPVVVEASSVPAQLPSLMRFGLPLMGASKVLRMRVAGPPASASAS